METLRFRSRVDSWLLVVAFAPIVAALWRIGRQAQGGLTSGLIVASGVTVLALALILWIFLDTSYTLTATDLVVRSGPVRATLPLGSIRKVRRSHTLLASPALSLRRLEIDHGTYDSTIISPRDQVGFLAALTARAPTVEVESPK